MDDRVLLVRIEKLVDEEKRLRDHGELDEQETERLRAIEVSLDQCWDLLRQRRALREYGGDPDQAEVRPEDTVENYLQ